MPGSGATFSINADLRSSQFTKLQGLSGILIPCIPATFSSNPASRIYIIFTAFPDPVFCFQKTYVKKTNFASKVNKWKI